MSFPCAPALQSVMKNREGYFPDVSRTELSPRCSTLAQHVPHTGHHSLDPQRCEDPTHPLHLHQTASLSLSSTQPALHTMVRAVTKDTGLNTAWASSKALPGCPLPAGSGPPPPPGIQGLALQRGLSSHLSALHEPARAVCAPSFWKPGRRPVPG